MQCRRNTGPLVSLLSLVDPPGIRWLIHEDLEELGYAVQMLDGEAFDAEPDDPELGLQKVVELCTPEIGEAVLGRKRRLGRIYFLSGWRTYASVAPYCW